MLLSSKHSRPRYTGLQGSSDALAIGQLAAVKSPLVVIAASALEAQRLKDEIPFFAPNLRVHLLPDWETLPYDHFSPHQDLVSERLATLHHIRSNSSDVVIVPITVAQNELLGISYFSTILIQADPQYDISFVTNRISFNNPIVAFGERVGGTPLYFSQPYNFGIYAGDPAWGKVRPPLVELTAEQSKSLAAELKEIGFTMPGLARTAATV